MRRYLVISLLLFPLVAAAQYVTPGDSTYSARRPFRATQIIAPGVLVAGGMGIHFFAHDSWDADIRDGVLKATEGKTLLPIDDYAQYIPLTLHLGLGAVGAECRLDFKDRLIESLLAHAVCGAISWPSKQLFHTLRPNEANYHSFPSGHSSLVFTGAELMRIDYRTGWGIAGYGVAAGIGFSRIYRNWHWLSDVLFGAGIGILSANVGSWLLQPVKDLLRVDDWWFPRCRENMALVPAYDPWTGSATLQFAIVF